MSVSSWCDHVEIYETHHLVLSDFSSSIIHDPLQIRLYDQLREKMRSKKRVAFSCNCQAIGYLKQFEVFNEETKSMIHNMSTYSMAAPLAIQISYNHQCMIFSDFNNQKIVILELSSKQLKRVLPKQSGSVCLERNYNNKNQDALFIVSSLCIVKFDLHQLLTNNFNEQMALWTSEKLKNPSSMVVHESRQLFVTDTTDVKVFNTRNGQLLQVIQMPVNVKRVTGIDFLDHDTMIVGEGNPYNRLIVFKNVQNDNAENSERKFVWQFEKQLVESTASKNSSWSYSMYLTVDKASLNIIACDCYDHSIKIYTQHGDLLQSIGTSGSNLQQFRYPQGLCLDELTGELYVSDTDNSRIQIFK